MRYLYIIIIVITTVLVACQEAERQKLNDEKHLANDAIEYELKEYEEKQLKGTDDTVIDSPSYAYDQPPTKLSPKTALRDNVTLILEKEPLLNRYNIDIEVFKDTIFIRGNVYSLQDKQEIDDMLSGMDTAPFIKNELVLKPYFHPYQHYAYPELMAPELKPDQQIKEQVQQELKWSPFVNRDNISVSVENGHVTLTGKVDTKTEKRYAAMNAIEGGAFTVGNHLVVEYNP